ncbi:alpha/beta hydrolase [Tabrizicola sp. M-4]|uniref:alpha/beta hydrolase n=1 Tax=Tabrizicola sp. M-4 TaxID=3055847 RepID=UPI003DA9F59D
MPATVVASRHDPWMTVGQSSHLAKVWGAELVDLGLAGQINVASGFGPWPAALTLRDHLDRRAGLPVRTRAPSLGRKVAAW